MANILTGLSRGTHQGLAHLATSKRAERHAARENRRYENELLFRIGQAKSAKADREKLFAYQKTRDTVADQQWADSMGLRTKQFDETVRSNQAREEDVDLARQLSAEQFDKTHTENVRQFALGHTEDIRQHEADIGLRREGILEGKRQFGETMRQRKQEHLDTMMSGTLAHRLAEKRAQTNENYYSDIIRLREQELNQAQTPEERAKIQAEIDRIRAQTDYYKAQTNAVGTGGTRAPVRPSWGQAGDIAATLADELIKEYTDFGITPWTGTLPWTDPSEKNARGTQPEMLEKLGTQTFLNLMRRFNGDASLAQQHLDSVFDAMLAHEKFGDHFRNDIVSRHPSPTLSDREKIEDARQMFLSAWRSGLAKQLSPTTTGTETDTGGIRNMTVPRSQHDFRNRGVR